MSARKPPTYSWLTILGSAAFLACSWTWCIGMFFPVFLLRDYGPASFPVFAIPNIIGAAGLAFMLSRPGTADAYHAAHRVAIGLFSAVTLAFQWFFLLWMLMGIGISPEAGVALGLAIVAMTLMERRGPDRKIGLRLSLLVFLFSVAMAFWFVPTLPNSTPDLTTGPNWKGGWDGGLAWFAPVSAVGFLLCPYLDGSFLEVRRRVQGVGGLVAFIVGFVGCFAIMLLLTWLYAGSIVGEARAAGLNLAPGFATLPVHLHMAVQLGFTIGVHIRVMAMLRAFSESSNSGKARSSPVASWGRLLSENASFLASLIGGSLVLLAWMKHGTATMGMSELIYRGFMACYGVVFPAYVLIAGWPRGRVQPPTPAHWGVWMLVSVAGCGCAWMAFVEGRSQFVLGWAGVMAVSAIAGVALRRRPTSAQSM